MAKTQPTAAAFARKEQSWKQHLLNDVQKKIEDRESWLDEKGWPREEYDNDDELLDLYDDEAYYIRFIKDMESQRAFLHAKFFNE